MTRPRKQTVDYFPHYCRHGKTMAILEERYGNNGYAFWFKLLEILGDTEGHALDCKDLSNWHYLSTRTHFTEETTQEILNILSDLKAIDPTLWKKNKVIWSDNFVNGLTPLYQNRRSEIPSKPSFLPQKSAPEGLLPVDNRKEEDSIGKDSIGKKRLDAPLFFSCTYFGVDFDYRQKLLTEYPLLDDQRLTHELSKMEDWLSDNPGRKKYGANGKVKNPKLFIKNWLDKIIVTPETLDKVGEPKGYAGLRDFLRGE